MKMEQFIPGQRITGQQGQDLKAGLSDLESLSLSQGPVVPCCPVLWLGPCFSPTHVPNANHLPNANHWPTAFLGLHISSVPAFLYRAQPWAS